MNSSCYVILFFILAKAIDSIYIFSADGGSPNHAVSYDNGKTWTTKSFAATVESEEGFCFSEETCYLIGTKTAKEYNIYKTYDKGNTWAKTTFKLPGPKVNHYPSNMGFYCIDESNCIIGGYNVIARTKGDSNTITRSTVIPDKESDDEAIISGIYCFSNSLICIATVRYKYDGAIYQSKDGGHTWKFIRSTRDPVYSLSCVTTTKNQTFCLIGQKTGTLEVSIDFGTTWKYFQYQINERDFSPSCSVSRYPRRCYMTKRLDQVKCLQPYHCVVTFKGYQTGSGLQRSEQSGAICSFKKQKGKIPTFSCSRLTRYNKGVKVHCQSETNCIAVTTQRYVRYQGTYKTFKYEVTNYQYQPSRSLNKWTSASKPNLQFSSIQRIFGSQSAYVKDFDFKSGGVGFSKIEISSGIGTVKPRKHNSFSANSKNPISLGFLLSIVAICKITLF